MNQSFEYKGIITQIIDESESVKRFFVELTSVDVFEFIPGQFVIVSFPEIEHKFPYRSYSIASAPESNIIELCVVLKNEGAATPLLFDKKVGDTLEFSKALGSFILPEDTENTDLCFICTGTGVAPFRSMIQHFCITNWKVGNITLIFGCRTQKDMLYRKEFEELAILNNKFTYIPVLSQEKWEGCQGYLHQVYLNKPEWTGLQNTMFYICGWSQMVKEAKNNLKAMGYSRKEIKFELYD